jgi:hypothetical protein
VATTTTRLGLRKPDPDPLTGDYVSAGDDLNDNWDNIDGKIPFTVCTSGTRPGTPYDGQPIRETDTLDAYVWDAANAKWVKLMIEDQTTNWPEIIGITRATSGLGAFQIRITGEASRRWEINSTGQMFWGDGTASPDTNLYRSAANELKTDDSLVVGGAFTPSTGYLFKQRVIFTANGTFTKASYTGLRAVRVMCQAGGNGGGGAAATGASQTSGGSGGRGGGYAESFILAAALASSETVTVGAGGAGVSGASGAEGGDSSFGSLVIADHGDSSSVGLVAGAGGTGGFVTGQAGTQVNTGDLVIGGGPGGAGGRLGTSGAVGGTGGNAVLGPGGGGTGITTGGATGNGGRSYGGGGGGACVGPSLAARAGGDGAAGIVIVDVYV